MIKNMGIFDRIIRTILAITVSVLYVEGIVTGIPAVILGIFALVFIATSAIGFCPLYLALGISTKRGENKP